MLSDVLQRTVLRLRMHMMVTSSQDRCIGSWKKHKQNKLEIFPDMQVLYPLRDNSQLLNCTLHSLQHLVLPHNCTLELVGLPDKIDDF
ncbi:PPR repeat [Musa troglodytarum]|uniref:PPR repeat n=1 Tax=Musa troglodytarum TaxID=320322 RepID=A0A9E7I2C9_9LILI|nr:PPR repeat [Musa troglodytarum]